MEKQAVIDFCASFWGISPELIIPEMTLDDSQLPHNSSIRFYLFMAEIEQYFNVRLEDVHTIFTFGDLFARLGVLV